MDSVIEDAEEKGLELERVQTEDYWKALLKIVADLI